MWPVSSVGFKLDDNDVKKLGEICSALEGVSEVVVTRCYSNECTFKFSPEASIPRLSVESYLSFLNYWKTKVGSAEAPNGQVKQQVKLKLQ